LGGGGGGCDGGARRLTKVSAIANNSVSAMSSGASNITMASEAVT